MSRHPQIGFGLALLAAMVWSGTGPGIKYLLYTYHVPNLTVAFWRDAFIALVCVAVFGLFRPGVLRVNRKELRAYALVGSFSIGMYHALWVLSIALNGAAVAVVLIYTFPVFVTLGSWLIFREPLRRVHIGALAVSLLGCALLARAYDLSALQLNWLGVVIGIGTGIAHAVYVLFSQHSIQTRSAWTSLTYTMLFGAIALFVMSLVASPADMMAVGDTPTPWLILLGLAIGPTLGGYALFTLSLRYLSGTVASLVVVSEAPAGALLAFVLLGERLEPPQLIGIALILAAAIGPYVLPQPATAKRLPTATETALATTD